ncbi:uncharacterized protein LOC142163768 [Nicotiana tabacum]|uniref:Uncharacterized protein LOC142163768 n=1 Tax=Nicotiana tabacum TaxID=4097 RepID=A0AC58RW84_TOBAC
MEPFVQKEKIEGYKKFMGFHQCISNDNGKIWCFWTTNCQTTTMTNEDQQITINISEEGGGNGLFVTAVYAKCTSTERRELWHSLERVNAMVNGPWCVGGDFNSILDTDEKLEGRPYRINKSIDFSNCMNNCELLDAGYVGVKFTWCNNRRPSKRIWKRLDRIMINDLWLQKFQNNSVRHLVRTGSDHRPILMKCVNNQQEPIKYFRFMEFWTDQNSFQEVVQET